MTLYKDKYRIESTRLAGWDYSSPGYYFVTICVNKRECLFGGIINGEMVPNEFGRVVLDCWADLMNHYEGITLDEFVVMPNHIHGILIMLPCNHVETGFKPVLIIYVNPVINDLLWISGNHTETGLIRRRPQAMAGQEPVSTISITNQ